MHAPGVECRPLRQMTGQAEFNEVYITDARIPDIHRLGAVGDGWRVAMTTLMNERSALGASGSRRGAGAISEAVAAVGVAARSAHPGAAGPLHAVVACGPRHSG